jgi:hypothetical protein
MMPAALSIAMLCFLAGQAFACSIILRKRWQKRAAVSCAVLEISMAIGLTALALFY